MNAEIRACKRELRGAAAAALAAMTPGERAEGSARARALLASQPQWLAAGAVLFYAPLGGELDVWPLLEGALAAGKRVGLPRFVPGRRAYAAFEVRDPGADLKSGHFGIREPAGHCPPLALNRLDFILVPGVAFDVQGRRLGRGKGYYDQLLAGLPGTRCGVAFDQQVVPDVPVTSRDIFMNWIVTPTRWIRGRAAGAE